MTSELPGTPQELLTPQFLDRLSNPSGAVTAAFDDNDHTCDLDPGVPVRLYTAGGDTSVLPANAERCRQAISSHGGDASIVDLGDVDHVTSEQRGVPAIARWFTELR